MKVAKCVPAFDHPLAVLCEYEVWANDDAEIGDVFHAKDIGMVKIVGFVPVATEANKTEIVEAEYLKVGDEIYYDNEWRTVLSVWLHERSPYNKINVSQAKSTIPLSTKLDKNSKVERKSEKYRMSIALVSSHELVKQLQTKLIDFQALNDAPDRIEIVPSVFVDKAPILSALKADIKAEYSKLGEMIKKL